MKDIIFIFLKGFLMGLADTVPGVSGGTIALITGIYQRLISGIAYIASIVPHFRKPKKLWKGIKEIDFRFFIPLGLGIGLAIIFFSQVMKYLLDNKPELTFAFFFGLILASSILVMSRVKEFSPRTFISGFLGFLFSFLLIGLGVTTALGHSYLVIFVSGAIAICAMILPGISGAFLLLLLGQYEFLVNALHDVKLKIIATAGAGAIVGLLSFSRFLKYLFKRFPHPTLAFLAGLMLGSLRLTVEKMAESYNTITPLVITALAGFMLVFLLEEFFK